MFLFYLDYLDYDTNAGSVKRKKLFTNEVSLII